MSLNKNTIMVIAISVLVLLSTICLVSWFTLKSGFARLEHIFMQKNINRAQEIIADAGNNLAVKLADWSTWDDTYAFIEDRNETYIKSNLADSALELLFIEMMVFLDTHGNVVYFKYISHGNEASLNLPEELKFYFAEGSYFVNHQDVKSSRSGIVMLPRGPLIMASRPIITTDGKGPIRGTLVFAKYLDSAELERLGNIIKVEMVGQQIDSSELSPYFKAAHEALLKKGLDTFIKEDNSGFMSGYSLIKDINGMPVMILRVTSLREITIFGRTVLGYFILSLIAVGFLFGMAVYIPLEREIEGRRKAEVALQEQRDVLANIIEGTNVGTWRWNVQTGDVELNERWAEIMGYTLSELAPVSIKTWSRMLHPEDLIKSDELLQRHFAKEVEYYDIECRKRHKDGSWIYVHDCGKVVNWTPDGKPLLMTGTQSDISGRKRTEMALLESEKKFRAVFDSAQDGMLVVDLETHKLLIVNEAARRQLGYREAELDDLEVTDIYPAAYLQTLFGQMDQYARSEALCSSELPILRKDGTEFLVDVRSSRVSLNGRQYMLGIFRDITERKQLESYAMKMAINKAAAETAEKKATEIEAAYKELQRTQTMLINSEKLASLGRLVSELAHEVNNPLMIISGNAQLAMMIEAMSEEGKKHLDIIANECQRAKEVIRRVLRFARPSRGELKEVDISQSIEAVAGILENQLKLFSNVEIKRNYSAEPIRLLLDEQRMQEVFMNLLKNSHEAMPKGGVITIKTAVEGDFARIDFVDTGSGMSEETLRKIMEPFFTTKDTGTGIGLSVCYGIVKAHNGELRFESELGKGTDAVILLPLKEDQNG